MSLGIEYLEKLLELKNRGEANQKQLASGVQKILKDGLQIHNCQLSEKCRDELLAHDYLLNAQGIGVWLDRME